MASATKDEPQQSVYLRSRRRRRRRHNQGAALRALSGPQWAELRAKPVPAAVWPTAAWRAAIWPRLHAISTLTGRSSVLHDSPAPIFHALENLGTLTPP